MKIREFNKLQKREMHLLKKEIYQKKRQAYKAMLKATPSIFGGK